MADVSSEYEAALGDADEFEEEVTPKGGNFAPTWDFDAQGDLVGTYLRTETRNIKGEDRTMHVFSVAGVETDVWGAAFIDSRLNEDVAGRRLKITKTGKKVGRATEYKVFVGKGAIAA